MPKPIKPKEPKPTRPDAVQPTAADLALHQAEQDEKNAPKLAALNALVWRCSTCGGATDLPRCPTDGTKGPA